MSKWTEHTVPVEGGTLRVRERAPEVGSGQPVLFIHGGLVNGHLWDDVVERLGDDVRAIVPDLPFGGHQHPMDADADMSFAATAGRLVEVLNALDVTTAVIAANDTGGVAAQYLLVDHKDRVSGAILANIDCYENFPPKLFFWFPAAMQVPGVPWTLAQALRFRVGRFLLLGLLVRRLRSSEAKLLMGPLWSSQDARRDVKRWARTLRKEQTLALADQFGTYRGPVHVAWTEKDIVFSPKYGERLAADFPGGVRTEPITKSKTLSPLNQPGQFAERLRDLLDEVSAAGAESADATNSGTS